MKTKTLIIDNIPIEINPSDKGGTHYLGKQHVEEATSPMWNLIKNHLNPDVIIGVGANYGFTASVFARHFTPQLLTAIEPDPNLHPYLHKNITNNVAPKTETKIFQSLVSEINTESHNFGINPNGSQDNRVKPLKNWTSIAVSSVRLDTLMQGEVTGKPVFIKIDTQGYDPVVINSGRNYLKRHSNWLIRSEFAPEWMHSQSQNPIEFLKSITEDFDVYEAPGRVPFFFHNDISSRLKNPQ